MAEEGKPRFFIEPSVSATFTYSDNINLGSAGNRQSDFVTQIIPRIAINSTGGGRVRFRLDYALDSAFYSRESGRTGNTTRTNNRLAADARVEAIENFFFVDARAQVAQTTVSAFGVQPVDDLSVTGNRTELRTFSLSPYFKGVFNGRVNYLLKHTFTSTDSDASQLQDVKFNQTVVQLSEPNAFGRFGWGFDYLDTETDRPGALGAAESDHYRGRLNYVVNPELLVFASLGRETNNYSGNVSTTTRGLGLDWKPTDRTTVHASGERRFFGNGYAFSFNHRFPRSAFSLNLSRNATTTAEVLSRQVPFLTLPLEWAAHVSAIADPVARARELNDLIQAGIATVGVEQFLFLTNRVILVRTASGAYTIHGVRNTVTITANQTESASVQGAASIADDLSTARDIRSRSLSLLWSHHLTPLTSLSASATQTRSTADKGAVSQSRQNIFSVGLDSRIGAKTTGSLSYRHARFESTTARNYRENALIGTLNYTF